MQSAAENVDQWISPVNKRELLSSWKFYTPTIEDIGKELLLECEGSILFHTRPVIPFPQGLPLRPRQMITVNSNAGERAGSLSSPSITIVTYNVLAEVYATSEKHYHCPPLALLWEHRRENLVKEMIQYDADIVCLQEVQSDHFYAFFQPELKKLGYAGLYKQNRENGTAQLLMAVLLFIEWIDSICGNQNGSNSAIMLNLSPVDFIKTTLR
jgi:hypothetical protein